MFKDIGHAKNVIKQIKCSSPQVLLETGATLTSMTARWTHVPTCTIAWTVWTPLTATSTSPN